MDKPTFQFTKEGFAALHEEMRQLRERRPLVLKRMVEAREQGDLSENAGYHAAKEELGKIDSRISELKFMIRFGVVAESQSASVAGFGSTVLVSAGGLKKEFKIVSAQEADPASGKISDSSPIGKGLIGKKAGEQFIVETPNGKNSFEVLEIKK